MATSRKRKKKSPAKKPVRRTSQSKARSASAKNVQPTAIAPAARASLPQRVPGADPARFPVVGIGASAGGLEALEVMLAAVEPDSGMAYLVVTHQAPGRTSLLPELLAKHSRVGVSAAENEMKIVPDHIYVAPPGTCLGIRDETLIVEPLVTSQRPLPVDHLFRSLAKNEGDNAIGIVLSGNGSDGTLGVTEIKGVSGMVMAQEPGSARYAGMPRSAIATQLVDYVLPPKEMPAQLARYVLRMSRLRSPDTVVQNDPDPDTTGLQRVLNLLRGRTGNDFRSYKKTTVRRRVERRMTVNGLHSVREYAELLARTPHEVDVLFKELLISVTSFFRDPEAFSALETELGRLIRVKADGEPLRIWVAGCATGEESYSLAILVKELLDASGKSLAVQIFATDLDAQAVEVARAGKYSEGIAADVSPERLKRFFTQEDDGYRISKEIRELLVFASQNIIKDPPFTKLDLLSCRNLLIYLEGDLQKRILWLFSYSLRSGGLLLLGTSEGATSFEDLFTAVDKKWKLFQRRETGAQRIPELEGESSNASLHARASAIGRVSQRSSAGLLSIAERYLLAKFVPPSVLLSERGEVIFVHGRTGPFLEPAPGEPTNNVFNMAREGLRLELPAAVRQASANEAPIVRDGLQVKTNAGFTSVRLTVQRVMEPETLRGAFLASFEQEREEQKRKTRNSSDAKGHFEGVAAFEEELQRTRENLHGTIEELETSNEDLKSTNEELQSTNEELQSANEELETSREEMQSLNEELQTVNAELEERNRALLQVNDDMQNLLNSTNIATIFLDGKLAIKRFTTQAKKVFSLIDTDVGRPISDLAANLRYDGLVDEAREVLQSLVFREREIQTKEGAWRLMRVMPYRTHDNLIDGLVITFVDIDRVKRTEEDAQLARVYAENIVDAVGASLLVLDDRLRVVSANRAFRDFFKMTSQLVVGRALSDLGDGAWGAPALIEPLRTLLDGGEPIVDLSLQLALPQVAARSFRVGARRIRMQTGKPPLVLVALSPASERADAEPSG